MNIAIIDNHGMFMAGFSSSLEKFPEVNKVVMFFPDEVEKLCHNIQKLALDLLIIDVNLGGMSGFGLAKKISSKHSSLPIAFITGHGNQINLKEEARELGAAGFFLKDPKPDELLQQIKKVVAGEKVGLKNEEKVPRLTSREKEVLQYLCEGYTNKQLSKKFDLSVRQIERHKKNLMVKFDVPNDKKLLRKAINLGYEIIA